MRINITHNYDYGRRIETNLIIKYHPEQTIDMRNVWLLESKENELFNLIGHFRLFSPITHYRKFDLKCHIRLNPNYNFFGVASLDIEKKKYVAYLIGEFLQITESMVSTKVILFSYNF